MSTEVNGTEHNRDQGQDQHQDHDPAQEQASSKTSEGSTPGPRPEQDPVSNPASDTPATRTLPRTSPIVWGALILAFCGFVAQRTLNPGQLDAATWITATVIGLGLLLLGVGASVIVRNRRR
jgi:hypothetical protein